MPAQLPSFVTFVDVETTGLSAWDRVITLGAIRLTTADLAQGQIDIDVMHLAFDPRRDCSPEAFAVHGYDNWSLRHQELFAARAEEVWKFVHRAPVIVGHNIEFDARFLEREFRKAGCPPISRQLSCTMEAYRLAGYGGSASLDAACRRAGIARSGARHGALEDAWLSMLIFLWLHGHEVQAPMPEGFTARPRNWIEPPPRPEGELPRRTRKVHKAAAL
ncbi:3'-5' exonuclease [Methylorubrum extorquens]|uniref:3'-5' exonuclease n=1 Tax=Methylorubrum extorquens TaxID=408 RepID=UPI003F631BA5